MPISGREPPRTKHGHGQPQISENPRKPNPHNPFPPIRTPKPTTRSPFPPRPPLQSTRTHIQALAFFESSWSPLVRLGSRSCETFSAFSWSSSFFVPSVPPWFDLVRLRVRPSSFLPFPFPPVFPWAKTETAKPGNRVAVGMRVASHPPHRSVRALLTHTAPSLDAWRQSALADKDAGFSGAGCSARPVLASGRRSTGPAGCAL
jgi:hypothetical protein